MPKLDRDRMKLIRKFKTASEAVTGELEWLAEMGSTFAAECRQQGCKHSFYEDLEELIDTCAHLADVIKTASSHFAQEAEEHMAEITAEIEKMM